MNDLRDQIAEALAEHSLTLHGLHGRPSYIDPRTERIVRENAASRADAAMSVVAPKLEQLRKELAELRGALNWQTSCTSCARVLDASIKETQRAELAEAAIERARDELDSWQETIDSGVMRDSEWEQCLAANLPILRAILKGGQAP